MSVKVKIKVIKKGQVEKAKKPKQTVSDTKNAAAREMVSTVSTWVSDFQNRKREETNQAIGKFFSNRPQATGA